MHSQGSVLLLPGKSSVTFCWLEKISEVLWSTIGIGESFVTSLFTFCFLRSVFENILVFKNTQNSWVAK